MEVVLLRAAQADIRRAARFYEEEAAGLGSDFLAEIDRAVGLLKQNPDLGAPLPRGARKLFLRRFPFLVMYRAEAEHILVLAIAHQRRHPSSWLDRR
jgi:plasmid stabilization system protein ParE